MRRRTALALLAAAAVAACATLRNEVGYYWQSFDGHATLIRSARPVADVIGDPATPAALRARLETAQRIRRFASERLGLPDNASYQRYADLQRPSVVWNVVAAPALSLEPKRWCFAVVGCVSYRGYFDEAEARREAAALRKAEGLDTVVYGVPAYSTLGWSNWAGGDPLLNTFIGYPTDELARLVFHELAHQMLYVAGDTAFNESFATAVERLGGTAWQQAEGRQPTPAAAAADARRAALRRLSQATRAQLADVYASEERDAAKADAKAAVLRDFRAGYAQLRAGWVAAGVEPARLAGTDRWVAEANNAAFAAQAAYDTWVPAFEALFAQQGGDWARFHAAAQRIGALPAAEREAALRALAPPAAEPA